MGDPRKTRKDQKKTTRHRSRTWGTDDKNSCCGGWIGKFRLFAVDLRQSCGHNADGFGTLAIVVGKGGNSGAFVISITYRNAEAVIPSRENHIVRPLRNCPTACQAPKARSATG